MLAAVPAEVFISGARVLCAVRQHTKLIFDKLTRVNLKRLLVTYLALHIVLINTYKHHIMYLEVFMPSLTAVPNPANCANVTTVTLLLMRKKFYMQ